MHNCGCTNMLAFDACRYSAGTIDALEMMDDDKVDLDLIAALIRHIVLEEEVRFCFTASYFQDTTELWPVAVINNYQLHSSHLLHRYEVF